VLDPTNDGEEEIVEEPTPTPVPVGLITGGADCKSCSNSVGGGSSAPAGFLFLGLLLAGVRRRRLN
jgi:MYXO-CTERM domain-containing protein